MLEEAPGAAPTTCFHHTDRETGRRCTRCGRPACPQCLHEAPVGSHCWECIRAAAPPRHEQVRQRLASEPLLASKALIAANVAVFVLMVVQGANLAGTGFSSQNDPRVDWVLFGPLVSIGGEWWRIFTSGFIHFGILHIAFNMLILFQVAIVLERVAGSFEFTIIYVVSLVAGSLGVLLLDPNQPTAGASGAVFGVAAATTLYLYRRGVPFWQTGFGPLLVINLVLTFTSPLISVGGHLGGLVGGTIAGMVLLRDTHTKAERRMLEALTVGLGVVLFLACLWAADSAVGRLGP
jgi:membrane associated rhomboid family serine protease